MLRQTGRQDAKPQRGQGKVLVELEQLAPQYREPVREILARYPELKKHLRLTGGSAAARRGEAEFDLTVENPRNRELSLELSAGRFGDGEVIVFIHQHHSHCTPEESAQLLDGLLSEQLVYVYFVQEDNWAASWFAAAQDKALESVFGSMGHPPMGCLFPSVRRRERGIGRVYSWNGTYDRVIITEDLRHARRR